MFSKKKGTVLLMTLVVAVFGEVFTGDYFLVTIHHAGHAEIGGGLNPENADFGQNLAEGGSHGVDPDESPDAECAGEKPRDTLPSTRDARLWP